MSKTETASSIITPPQARRREPRNPPDTAAVGKLLPYLTANVQFKVDERKDALLVPNAAVLTYRPTLALVAPEFRSQYEQGLRRAADDIGSSVPPKAGSRATRSGCRTATASDPSKCGCASPTGCIPKWHEVIKEKLTPEAEVVIGENDSAVNREGTVNPFGPHSSRRR